jgi:opacity protein-like surface antigen
VRKILYAITAVLLFSFNAFAITGVGIGVHVGQVNNYSYSLLTDKIDVMAVDNGWLNHHTPKKNMSLIGAHINVGTLQIIDFTGFVDYAWNKSNLISGVDLKLSDFSFGITAKKKFSTPFVKPYFGAGIGWHRLVYSMEIKSAGVIIALPDNQTKTGYHAVGGIEASVPMFPLVPYLEYRYNWVLSQKSTTKFGLINLGVSFNF